MPKPVITVEDIASACKGTLETLIEKNIYTPQGTRLYMGIDKLFLGVFFPTKKASLVFFFRLFGQKRKAVSREAVSCLEGLREMDERTKTQP